MFQALTPEDIKPMAQDVDQLKNQMALVMTVIGSIRYVSREQAAAILGVSYPTLWRMTNKGEVEYKKGKLKIEYSLLSLLDYLTQKKRLMPTAARMKVEEAIAA